MNATIKKTMHGRRTALWLCAMFGLAVGTSALAAPPAGKGPGTTLAATKTIDICEVSPATDTTLAIWRFSGDISVWNSGAIDTLGFNLTDTIQNKVSGPTWTDDYTPTITPSPAGVVIPAGTTQTTATVFQYSIDAPSLLGDIRNVADATILNHSGSMGTAFGPEPKATYGGPVPPPACVSPLPGCTYTQGYWSRSTGENPPVWPAPYDRNATFYLSGQTWQQVLDTPVNVSQGYYQLAHQYIAALLNQANGASVPSGVQDILNQADAWFTNNAPSACVKSGPGPAPCGQQITWAATLDDYNNGTYPGGPKHCE